MKDINEELNEDDQEEEDRGRMTDFGIKISV